MWNRPLLEVEVFEFLAKMAGGYHYIPDSMFYQRFQLVVY
jgi:hypothetical protein